MSGLVKTNYNGDSGMSTWKSVTVLDVDENNHLAICQDQFGIQMKITTIYQPAKAVPLVGEKWFIERKFGIWVFSYYIQDLTV